MVTKPYCFQILFCKSNDSNSEHDHFTISDCFHLSILTGVLKINIPIIDTFDICALCNIRKTLPTYRRDRWRLVHPEVVTLGGPNSHLQSLQGWHQGNGARLFIVMCGWKVKNNRC